MAAPIVPPSISMARRAAPPVYQGPVPLAVGPAAAAQHNTPMAYAPQVRSAGRVGMPGSRPWGGATADPYSLEHPPAAAARHDQPMTYAGQPSKMRFGGSPSPTRPPLQASPPLVAHAPAAPFRSGPAPRPPRTRPRPAQPARSRHRKAAWLPTLFLAILFVLMGTDLGTRLFEWLQQLVP